MKTNTKTQTKASKKNTCICGCNSPTKSRFAPGHDSKLHSLVDRIVRKDAKLSELPRDARTREYLMKAPWMTKKIRDVLGLKKQAPQAQASA